MLRARHRGSQRRCQRRACRPGPFLWTDRNSRKNHTKRSCMITWTVCRSPPPPSKSRLRHPRARPPRSLGQMQARRRKEAARPHMSPTIHQCCPRNEHQHVLLQHPQLLGHLGRQARRTGSTLVVRRCPDLHRYRGNQHHHRRCRVRRPQPRVDITSRRRRQDAALPRPLGPSSAQYHPHPLWSGSTAMDRMEAQLATFHKPWR